MIRSAVTVMIAGLIGVVVVPILANKISARKIKMVSSVITVIGICSQRDGGGKNCGAEGNV